MALRAEDLKIAGLITLVGAACGFCLYILFVLDIGLVGRDLRQTLRLPYALVAAASVPGAAVGGILTARLFGRPGKWGWALALVGAVLSTIVGALVAGMLLPKNGWAGFEIITMYPILLFALMIIYFPFGLLWLAMMALTHRCAAVFRGNSETVLFRKRDASPR